MKNQRLPYQLDTKYLCQEASSEGNLVTGIIKVSDLPNMQGILVNNSGEVTVTLKCRKDEEGYPCIAGSLSVELQLTCERCLGEMGYLLKAEFLVSPVETEAQVKHLPERYEPVMVTEGRLSLPDWLSEEILLNLPLAPKHEESFCNSESLNVGQEEVVAVNQENPFKVLGKLK